MRWIILITTTLITTTALADELCTAKIAWCDANGVKWAEMGPTCHANVAERKPFKCVCSDNDGNILHPLRFPTCSVKPGWEKALSGIFPN